MTTEQIQLIQTDGVPPEVVEQILPSVETLLAEAVDMDYQAERILQLLRLQKSDAFDRGIQNVAPTMDDNGVVRMTPFGVSTGSRDDQEGTRELDYNPRKTRSYRDKFVAVLGQRPFYNCTAEPNDPTSNTDRRGARQVNLLIQKFQNEWPLRKINNQLFFFLFKHGTALGKVRPVTDAKKFGTTDVPNMVPQEEVLHPGGHMCIGCGGLSEGTTIDQTIDCPGCGAPLSAMDYQPPITATTIAQQGVKSYANTSIEVDLLNGYFYTVPFNVQSLKTPWLIEECEKHKGEILKAIPNARKIVGNVAGGLLSRNAAETTATTARMASQTQMGTISGNRTNLWSFRQKWLDTAVFELIQDDTKRALVQQYWPLGMMVTQVEDKVVALKNVNLEKRFSYCQPSMSDYLYCDGISWGMHGMDDAYSNLLNIAQQTLESGIARYALNPDYFDGQAMNDLRYSPNRFVEMLPKTGESLESAFRIFPPASYPTQLPEMMTTVDQSLQHICGVLEQLFGEMPPNLTLGQARMMLNQGLMQLGTVGDNATNFYEQTFTNAVNLLCDVSQVNPNFHGEQIDLELIRNSSWSIKGGTVMPRTFAERQTELLTMLTTTPQLADALKVTHPVNFDVLTSLLDLPDLKNPDMDAMEAIGDIIDQLWEGTPQQPPQGPPDPITGMLPPPGPPEPSIPFDSLVYPAQMAVQLAQAALLERNGQNRQNTPGYANVRAFLQAAQDAASAQAAASAKQPTPPPKLSISAKIPDLTPEMEGAIFNDFSLNVPAPHPGQMEARAMQPQGAPAGPGGSPPSGGGGQGGAPPPPSQPSGSGPGPGMPPADTLLQAGVPSMAMPPAGA